MYMFGLVIAIAIGGTAYYYHVEKKQAEHEANIKGGSRE